MDTFMSTDRIHENQLIRLMEQYEKDLLRMCCIYLRDISLAEDAVQETFLKAYKNLDALREDAYVKSWLITIAINTCKDIRRSAWFRYVNRHITIDQFPAPTVHYSMSNMEITLEVMRLPRKSMEVVLLYYYQGMNQKEIAQILGISSPAVSKRLRQAYSQLRPVLEGRNDR